MHLDITTLIAAGSFVVALSGLLLTGAWTQIRVAPALLWWAAANYVYAIGIGLLAYGAATGTPVVAAAGGALTSLSPALIWAGTRTFVHRPVSALVFAGAAVWIVAGVVGAEGGSHKSTLIAGFAAWSTYLLASNWELWRARAEPLMARWPLMTFFGLHAVVFLGGIYDVIFHELRRDPQPPLGSWFGLIHFETLVYAIGATLFMAMMCKQRSELGYIKEAHSDMLTGIANRGAFFAGAERLLDRCRMNATPLSVIVFDLDRFKSINDAHGHAAGDRVLGIFVDATRSVLRSNDFFGRHGGEEFAVVLPGATVETAHAIADRARHAFAEACRKVGDLQIFATVSAGVAGASLSASFSDALAAADGAMYRAKNRGRNRVERAGDSRSDQAANIIRVA